MKNLVNEMSNYSYISKVDDYRYTYSRENFVYYIHNGLIDLFGYN